MLRTAPGSNTRGSQHYPFSRGGHHDRTRHGTRYPGRATQAPGGQAPSRVIPPNDYQPLTFSKPRSAILSYCRAGDPGHTVDVSPVEPTVRALLGISSR